MATPHFTRQEQSRSRPSIQTVYIHPCPTCGQPSLSPVVAEPCSGCRSLQEPLLTQRTQDDPKTQTPQAPKIHIHQCPTCQKPYGCQCGTISPLAVRPCPACAPRERNQP